MIRPILGDAGTAIISGTFTRIGIIYAQSFGLPAPIVKLTCFAAGVFLSSRFAKYMGGDPTTMGMGFSAAICMSSFPEKKTQVALVGLVSSVVPRFFSKRLATVNG